MSLLQLLSSSLTPETLGSLASQLGATPQQTESAANAAVPALLGSLSGQPSAGGLSELLGGGAASAIGGLLGGGAAPAGDPVTRLLGDKLGPVSEAIAKASGLSAPQVQQLLGLLIPLVMKAVSQSPNAAAAGGGLLDRDGDGSVVDDVASLAMKGLFGK